MKKTLLTFCSALAAIAAQAQIIDRTDIGYPISSYDIAEDTLAALPSGFATGGDSLTWDFSGAANHYTTKMNLLRPQDVPEASNFPDCNAVLQDDESIDYYNFLNITDSVIYNLGDNNEDPFASQMMVYRHMLLPLTKGTTWLDERNSQMTFPGSDFGAPVDSIRITINGTFNSECDANGTLKLPVGDAQVLRIKTHINIEVIVEAKSGPSGWIPSGGQNQEFIFYSFYGKKCGFRLATVTVDPNNPTEGGLIYRSTNLLSKKDIVKEMALTVYPNPATGNTVYVDGANSKVVSIYDLSGRVMTQASTLPAGKNSISIEHLKPGTYLIVVVEDSGKTSTQKFVKH